MFATVLRILMRYPETLAWYNEWLLADEEIQAKVYSGIGCDVPTYVPGGMEPFPSKPETTYRATRKAIEAGAHGVVASREYDEMTLPNFKAFGRGGPGRRPFVIPAFSVQREERGPGMAHVSSLSSRALRIASS